MPGRPRPIPRSKSHELSRGLLIQTPKGVFVDSREGEDFYCVLFYISSGSSPNLLTIEVIKAASVSVKQVDADR